MARMKNTDYVLYFNVKKFETELRKALRKATRDVQDILICEIHKNINELPFKSNPVRLAEGGVTSDYERKEALLSSIKRKGHIKTQVVNFTKYKEGIVIKAAVSAMEKNFKDSHIGWYYEIGTGEESDPAGYAKYGFKDLVSVGHENPYRLPDVGAPIVSRSSEEGPWVDLGGNLRTTRSGLGGIGGPKIPGGMNPIKYYDLVAKFRKYIGEDIEAYYWFEKAVEATNKQLLDIYKKAINMVDIFNPNLKIFHWNKKITISDKYTVTERGGWGCAGGIFV